MSRWHAPSCSAPEVCLHEGIPHCRNCKETASASLRDAKPTSANASLSIPPDEPPGSLNLSWPPSIRWEGALEEIPEPGTQPAAMQDGVAYQRHEEESHLDSTVSNQSHIYPRPLRSNEIRFICLGGEKDRNAPIHLTLEVHDTEDCPEYETVSYTWTGGYGDAELSAAIFVGPYWDISFQTRNILSLLRYLRPRRGLRFIWIDAICINQTDVMERTSQVANMGNIYFRCSRVVVWLGHDIVQESPTKHRRRRRLGEIEEEFGNASKLEELLRRRYFSRMWVIQEVVLAPSSIFPIGQVDFFATAKAAAELPSILGDERWNSVRVGWLEYMHDRTRFRGQDLLEVLHLVSPLKMHATDPRDKVFGILGLLQSSSSESLKPRYSLSAQNVMIGTLAHFLLDLKHEHLLKYALGRKAASPFPSWLPDWNNIWHGPANGASKSSQDVFPSYTYTDRFRTELMLADFVSYVPMYTPESLVELSFCSLEATVWFQGPWQLGTVGFNTNWRETRYAAVQPTWLDDASIRRSDAALTINVLHLMVLEPTLGLETFDFTNLAKHLPFRERLRWDDCPSNESRAGFPYLARRGSCSLVICVDHPALKTIVGNDGPTSLCIAKTCGTSPYDMALLALQPLDGNCYRLITYVYCRHIYIQFPRSAEVRDDPNHGLFSELREGEQSFATAPPWCTLSSLLHGWRLFIGDGRLCNAELEWLFIDRELTLEMRLRLVQSVQSAQRSRFAYELQEIAMEVCSDLSPRITGGALEYTGNAQLFGDGFTMFKSRPHELREDAVIWAFDLDRIREWVRKTEMYDYMKLFHAFKQVTGEDEISMALREPRPEDSEIYPPSPWPESVAQELGLDGKIRRIRIV